MMKNLLNFLQYFLNFLNLFFGNPTLWLPWSESYNTKFLSETHDKSDGHFMFSGHWFRKRQPTDSLCSGLPRKVNWFRLGHPHQSRKKIQANKIKIIREYYIYCSQRVAKVQHNKAEPSPDDPDSQCLGSCMTCMRSRGRVKPWIVSTGRYFRPYHF